MSNAGRYRKKPVEIEALQWSGSNWHEMLAWVKWENHDDVWVTDGDKLQIPTLEGTMTASPSDWIIKGIADEYYPCKNEIFEQTYEAVEQQQ